MATVSSTIDQPQGTPTLLWKNFSTASKTSISGWKMLAVSEHGQALVARARGGLNSRWSSTGSNPPWLQGLQRSSRQPASTSPRSMPNRSIACAAYSEHEG